MRIRILMSLLVIHVARMNIDSTINRTITINRTNKISVTGTRIMNMHITSIRTSNNHHDIKLNSMAYSIRANNSNRNRKLDISRHININSKSYSDIDSDIDSCRKSTRNRNRNRTRKKGRLRVI